MAVPLLVHETLFLSIKMVETRFLPPSIPSKWRGLRGLVVQQPDLQRPLARARGHAALQPREALRLVLTREGVSEIREPARMPILEPSGPWAMARPLKP